MSHLKLSINEPLFCHDGMRVPVQFCGEGLIETICESRKKWLSVRKIPFRVLSPVAEAAEEGVVTS